MIQSSQIESSIRSLTFGTDKVVLALNDEKANLNYFDEADTLKVSFSDDRHSFKTCFSTKKNGR